PCCCLVALASLIYTSLGSVRRFLYLKNVLKPRRLSAKVISVGNIVAGGTGKTPVVIYLARGLVNRGYQVAVL
ncbi:MAG: tetraacyldisaccharide 4'-kinase, partial [Armatimonadetes bacterium]|nr:tetraacyldisaccharide 4'-kinase [Armatimonadota bacterium]NIM23645.1 tetraacyldisaccharide 4'-kinase [Armatimonadota bacterium]NIM67515.1 tetraacyldisaccharide 4'-kinase [Armatimonadota bacterium]NIO96998.1 tetraacyldisaccharide 4'-kinase [Armatimonadota bacterium]NIT31074.1 tetraacyldisaccharide 4'-kinase [Armatimonadota bacterium]